MTFDQIVGLFFALVITLFSTGIRFWTVEDIRKSETRSEESKRKMIKAGKIISSCGFLIAIYWIVWSFVFGWRM